MSTAPKKSSAAPSVCRNVTFEELAIGEQVTFSRTWTDADVATFAHLVGDLNPIHVDDSHARTSLFERRIVHGMLVGSLCSTLVGMHLPGKRCLYLEQSLSFLLPVFIDDTVEVTGTVVDRDDRTQVITVSVDIVRDADLVLQGLARVQVM